MRHRAGSSSGEPGRLAQVGDELFSAAERVSAGPYPEPVGGDVNGRVRAGPRQALLFQQAKNAAYRPAAGGRAGVIRGDGPVREGVPGESGVVTRCLFGDGKELGKRGGGLAGVGQRPSGVVAGDQPQVRVGRDRQGAGSEIVDPVPLAGGNSGRGSGDQPARPVLGGRAQFSRTFHRHRGGSRTTTALRLGRRGLEQGSHLFVRLQRRGGQVPGSPVWLVVQGLGQFAVRCGTLRERRGVIDGRTDKRVGEVQASPVYRDQAELLGWGKGTCIRPGTPAGCRTQVRAVGYRGQPQRGLRRGGQGAEPGDDDSAQPVSQRQRLGGPPSARGGVCGNDLGQLDQRHRITRCLSEHLRPGPPVGRVRLPVQQATGRSGG